MVDLVKGLNLNGLTERTHNYSFITNLKDFYSERPIIVKFIKGVLAEGLKPEGYWVMQATGSYEASTISLSVRDYTKNDPLLSFTGFKCIFRDSYDDSQITFNQTLGQIFETYKNEFNKASILKCQKDLIDAGFSGNAHW
jgi:hypothetical protein